MFYGRPESEFVTSNLFFQLDENVRWQLSVLSMCSLACVLVSLLLYKFCELRRPSLLGDWHSLIPRCLNLVHLVTKLLTYF